MSLRPPSHGRKAHRFPVLASGLSRWAFSLLFVCWATIALAQGYINPPQWAKGYYYVQPGGTVTTKITNSRNPPTDLVALATGAITTWNVILPAPPYDGQIVEIACPGGNVGTINVSTTDGSTVGTIVGTSCTQGATYAKFQYSQIANSWFGINTFLATPSTGGLAGATPNLGLAYANGPGPGITTPVANSVACRNGSTSTPPTECTTLPSGLTIPAPTMNGTVTIGNPADSGTKVTEQGYLVPGTNLPKFYAHGNAFGTAIGLTNLYQLGADSDTVAGGLSVLYVGDSIGGAGTTGNRNGVESFLNINSATSDGAGNASFYTAFGGITQVSANLGGTSLNYGGNPFGGNTVCHLLSGATFVNSCIGSEDDIQADTGSNVNYLVGHQIAITNLAGGGGAVAGNVETAGLTFSAQGNSTAKFSTGIGFGSPQGNWAFGNTSTLIGNLTGIAGDASHIALNGVDFSAITFQAGGCAFKSSGFCVNPAGTVTSGTWNGNPIGTSYGGLFGATNNAIPYGQTGANPAFVSPVNNAVLATNGSGVPSEVTTLPNPFSVGTSLFPAISQPVSTTGTGTINGTSFTVASGTGIAAGQGIYATWIGASCAGSGGAFIQPTVDTSYTPGSTTVPIATPCKVTTTEASATAVQFGQQPFDPNATFLANSLGGEFLRLGDAATSNSNWLNQISTGNDFRGTQTATIISSPGVAGALTLGSRTSEATTGGGSFPLRSYLYVDSWATTRATENAYFQSSLSSATAGLQGFIGIEESLNTVWPQTKIDPYSSLATVNATTAHRIDCGTGQSSNNPNNCSAAFDFPNNGAQFESGFVPYVNAFDTSSGFAPFLALPEKVGIAGYSAANTIEYQIYGNTVSTVPRLIMNIPSGAQYLYEINGAGVYGVSASAIFAQAPGTALGASAANTGFSSLYLDGATSGYVQVQAPATAPSTTVTLDPSVWTTYSPIASCATNSGTWGTVTGRYKVLFAHTTTIEIDATLTTAGTCSGAVQFTLPNTAVAAGSKQIITGREDVNTGSMLQGQIGSGATSITSVVSYANAAVIASGDRYYLTGTYENQ